MAADMNHSESDKTVQADSAADLLLQRLADIGVDYFFGNGGTDFPPIAEAFARAESMNTRVPRPMVIPHENVAVAMAHGVYMISGKPQAVMVHVNVGTANTINAVLDASRDETPVLLFAGRSPYSETCRHGTRTRYIHWAQEMFDQAGMLREAVKWDYELHHPEQAGDLVSRAYQIAMANPRGPVYATLPRDILAAPVGSAPVAAHRHAVPSIPHPAPAAMALLSRWISEAERPLIVTASAGRTVAGFEALAQFADQYAVPVVSFHPRFLNIASDHPMNFGSLPGPLLANADLVIALDCDVPWIPTLESPPTSCRIVHIGADPARARYPMWSFPADLCLTGETAAVLSALCAGARDVGEADAARIASRRARLNGPTAPDIARAAVPTADAPITAEWLSTCIGEAIGEDAIIVNEYPLRLDHCPRTRSGSYFGLSPAGGLGWGLGAAIGAKLAAPDRLVVATLGDGAYMFANPTAAHFVSDAYGLPILTIVFNNALYGAVRNSTLAMYADGFAAKGKGRVLAELTPSPAFEILVEASGGVGFKVERASELPETLAKAVEIVTRDHRSVLVNVICND